MNERLITFLETDYGKLVVVMVGATNVGKMNVTFESSALTNARLFRKRQQWPYKILKPCTKGLEMGCFHMGSTVIVVAEKDFSFRHYRWSYPWSEGFSEYWGIFSEKGCQRGAYPTGSQRLSVRYRDIKVPLDQELEEVLTRLDPRWESYHIVRKSIDARKKQHIHFCYTIDVYYKNEVAPPVHPEIPHYLFKNLEDKPLIIGAGPAGLFAALRFVERGQPCVLIDRGSAAEVRMKSINRFWRHGILDLDNNVCFGEGGAGLFSDGKLITRIKSPHIPYVMSRLVQFGAPEEILYLANPHVGSDKIRRVIPKIREYLLANGVEIHYDTTVMGLLLEGKNCIGVQTKSGRDFHSTHTILATGHSAMDIYQWLHQNGVTIDGKSFAMGLRIEHPRELVNKMQYGLEHTNAKLDTATYKLTFQDKDQRVSVYSFCMCPGGYVLSSGTESDGVTCNGMSNYRRNSPYSNAALVVSIDFAEHFSTVMDGLNMRTDLEKKAYQYVIQEGGSRELPAQRVTDFLKGTTSPSLPKSLISVRGGNQPSAQLVSRGHHCEPKKGFRKF